MIQFPLNCCTRSQYDIKHSRKKPPLYCLSHIVQRCGECNKSEITVFQNLKQSNQSHWISTLLFNPFFTYFTAIFLSYHKLSLHSRWFTRKNNRIHVINKSAKPLRSTKRTTQSITDSTCATQCKQLSSVEAQVFFSWLLTLRDRRERKWRSVLQRESRTYFSSSSSSMCAECSGDQRSGELTLRCVWTNLAHNAKVAKFSHIINRQENLSTRRRKDGWGRCIHSISEIVLVYFRVTLN